MSSTSPFTPVHVEESAVVGPSDLNTFRYDSSVIPKNDDVWVSE